MKIQLIRHATCLIHFHHQKILVDPVLSPAGTISAIPDVPITLNNPLVELPKVDDLLESLDAILVTHTHRDHFDAVAMEILSKQIPLFCQHPDLQKIGAASFTNIHPVETSTLWKEITIIRTSGKHGTGTIGQEMGPVSGFVFKASTESTLYITGDTIWCPEVENALKQYQPEIIICYAGEARFQSGDPITMTKNDIYNLTIRAPKAKIFAVHMEAWNHCRLTRNALKVFCKEHAIQDQVIIPDNGDSLII